MKLKIIIGLFLFNCCFVFSQSQPNETYLSATIIRDSGALQKRAIRRNIPLTDSIQKAYRSGTRDTSGRPGANYWQLKTDYSINANLNPQTQTITGNEKINPMPNARIVDGKTAIVKWDVDVWFNGERNYQTTLNFGNRKIKKITLDPFGRFPDSNSKDNVWTAK